MTNSNPKCGPAGRQLSNSSTTPRNGPGQFASGSFLQLVGLIGWLCSSACSSDATRNAAASCVPGTTQACSCSATQEGIQECNDKGTFESCECTTEPDTKSTKNTTTDAGSKAGGDQPSDGEKTTDARTGGTENEPTTPKPSDAGSSGGPKPETANEQPTSEQPENGTGGSGPVDDPDGSGGTASTECQELPAKFEPYTNIAEGCYHAAVSPSIPSGATLEIDAGVTIVFEKDTGLVMRGGMNFKANGTADEPILLTGAKKERGFWQGVILDSSEIGDADFDYVTIEYAGASPIGASFRTPAAGLIASDLEYATFDNSTIRESGGYGFIFDDYEAPLASFENNTITRNQLGAGILTLGDAEALSASTKFSGNDVDYLSLVGSDVENSSITLPALDVPYFIADVLDSNADELTLSPGVQLVFGKDAVLDVWAGSLLALGSEDNPVVFTGLEATPGYWYGIVIESAASSTLRNAVVEYGGSAGTKETGNVMLLGNLDDPNEWGYLLMEDCTVRHSGAYGFVMGNGSINSDWASVNTFKENALGDRYDIPLENEEDW